MSYDEALVTLWIASLVVLFFGPQGDPFDLEGLLT